MDMGTIVAEAAPKVVGILPEGVVHDTAEEIARVVREKVERIAKGVTVRSLRMVPSSIIHLDAHTIQFVANATVVPISPDAHAPAVRAKVVDSVVTLDLSGAARVRDVVVPFLEPQPA